MSTSQDRKVSWKTVPTRTITAGGVEFAYRELGRDNPGLPVVFLVHLAAVMDNWDPRVVDGFAAKHRVVVFDNRGVGASARVYHPVLVANGDSDRMVPSSNTHDLARRLPNSELSIYPDSGHGAVFQFHADFVPKALVAHLSGRARNSLTRTNNMKALVFRRYGKRDNITFADVPRPLPKPDEIIVQVHAVGLNPIDTMVPKGSFKPMLKFQLPATLGSDLAGVVVETGSRVTRFKPGDAVFRQYLRPGLGFSR
jgi:Alcohol dehydrogenase GroES-like domain